MQQIKKILIRRKKDYHEDIGFNLISHLTRTAWLHSVR